MVIDDSTEKSIVDTQLKDKTYKCTTFEEVSTQAYGLAFLQLAVVLAAIGLTASADSLLVLSYSLVLMCVGGVYFWNEVSNTPRFREVYAEVSMRVMIANQEGSSRDFHLRVDWICCINNCCDHF